MPMNAPAIPNAILLATDLSARSDRALERATQLARHWQARLVVLVAMSTDAEFSLPNRTIDFTDASDAPPPQTPAQYVERLARRDLADAGPIDLRVVIGKPGPTASAVATETGCGLIVTGTSHSEVASRLYPGSTLCWLARNSDVPVLAVHDRVRGPYRAISMASDYSTDADAALRLADRWFGDAPSRTVLHGYEVPLGTMSLNDGPRREALDVAQSRADAEARDHLARALGEAASGWNPVARHNGPVRLLRDHSREHATELTVIASHGRSRLIDRLIGSVAERLLETVGTDLLVVRPQRG